MKDVTIWHANVSLSFVTNVEVFTWNANAYKKQDNSMHVDSKQENRVEEERHNWLRKERNRNNKDRQGRIEANSQQSVQDQRSRAKNETTNMRIGL